MAHAARRTQDQRIAEPSILVRLKAHDPKKGLVLKQYTYQGIRFQAGRGWYKVNGELAAYLANVHSVPGNPDTPLAFDVRTPEEARAMDENDRKAALQVLAAEEPLDVSQVRDEPSSLKSRRSTERGDATRQQRQAVCSPDDEGIEDEATRRRASRPRSQTVHRPRPRADEFEDFGAIDEDMLDAEDAEFEGEAPRRCARRSRTGAVPRRRARNPEDFDALDEDELDAEDDEFDDDEEYLQAEPPLARRRIEARAPRHRREYDSDDDVSVRRSRQRPDEFGAFDDEPDDPNDEDIEGTPPPHRLTHRSHGPRARAANDYDRGDALDAEPLRHRHARQSCVHDELDDDRQVRRAQAARQAEALDAFQNRETRRMRRQDQYEEMLARGVHEDAVERELDNEPTQKLARSRSQARHQDELHTRYARQMAAKLKEFDALDDAMSHGDAEDSLPNQARRNRYMSHGNAEDSLPTRNRHNGHKGAEDSLPGVRRMQHQDTPSARHTVDDQDALDAVAHDFDHRNVERSAQLDTRGQRAQQPPSSAAHHELDALDDALDDRLQEASEDQRPGSAHSDACGQRAQKPPSNAAHDELDALDDALDDRLQKASEDQRPGSAQPQHGQQHMGSSPQRHPENGHETASCEDSRHQGLLQTDDDLFMNGDMRHQVPAPGREPAAVVAANPRPHRCTDTSMQNSHTRNPPDMLARPAIRGSAEKLAQPRQRAPLHDRQPPQRSPCPERTKRLLPPPRTCRRSKGLRLYQAVRRRPGEHDARFKHTAVAGFTHPRMHWRLKVRACLHRAPERDCANQSTTEYSSKRKSSMQKTISVQINELQGMSVGELREKYEELFNETPRSRNKHNLIKRIAYRMQEQLEGSLSERARKRVAELADEAHIHIRATPGTRGEDAPVKVPVPAKRDPRLPAAGTVLVREFGGKRHEITICEQDVLYAGKSYRSLSSVARAIAGTPWNGFRFFGLTSEEKK